MWVHIMHRSTAYTTKYGNRKKDLKNHSMWIPTLLTRYKVRSKVTAKHNITECRIWTHVSFGTWASPILLWLSENKGQQWMRLPLSPRSSTATKLHTVTQVPQLFFSRNIQKGFLFCILKNKCIILSLNSKQSTSFEQDLGYLLVKMT